MRARRGHIGLRFFLGSVSATATTSMAGNVWPSGGGCAEGGELEHTLRHPKIRAHNKHQLALLIIIHHLPLLRGHRRGHRQPIALIRLRAILPVRRVVEHLPGLDLLLTALLLIVVACGIRAGPGLRGGGGEERWEQVERGGGADHVAREEGKDSCADYDGRSGGWRAVGHFWRVWGGFCEGLWMLMRLWC